MEKIKKIDVTLDKLYNVIKNFIGNNGYPPSIRELMPFMNVTSTSTINYYLKKLEERKLIKRDDNKNRAIEIIGKNTIDFKENLSSKQKNTSKKIPLLGDVAAGTPILAVENYDEVFEISNNLFNCSSDLFMLNVHGESMINAGILNGDKIVVRRQDNAENNEIVVAMHDGNVTVKRFFKEKNRIRLQPENDTMSPIYCDNVEILGKVIGLIRNF